jgi:hypothetical protein
MKYKEFVDTYEYNRPIPMTTLGGLHIFDQLKAIAIDIKNGDGSSLYRVTDIFTSSTHNSVISYLYFTLIYASIDVEDIVVGLVNSFYLWRMTTDVNKSLEDVMYFTKVLTDLKKSHTTQKKIDEALDICPRISIMSIINGEDTYNRDVTDSDNPIIKYLNMSRETMFNYLFSKALPNMDQINVFKFLINETKLLDIFLIALCIDKKMSLPESRLNWATDEYFTESLNIILYDRLVITDIMT